VAGGCAISGSPLPDSSWATPSKKKRKMVFDLASRLYWYSPEPSGAPRDAPAGHKVHSQWPTSLRHCSGLVAGPAPDGPLVLDPALQKGTPNPPTSLRSQTDLYTGHGNP